jgi:threonine dehydrogenase-like Zn-dependent dehydrogenase
VLADLSIYVESIRYSEGFVIGLHLESGRVEVRRSRMPRRPRGHALLRLRLGGICNTDLELQRGYYGFCGRPGHEFVADVVECDSPRWRNRRVVGEINLACGECAWCRRGLGRHCPKRTVLGIVQHPGAFAEYLTLPEENLHAIPETMPDERAVFAEPVAAACEILDQVEIANGSEAAVLGDGKLGLLIAQVLAIHGARVSLYGHHERRLGMVRPLGVRRGLARCRYPLVVDATGSSAGLAQAIAMTEPRGALVAKSTVHDRVAIDLAPLIVNEIRLIGSRCGRFAPALKLLAGSELRTAEIIADRYALADGPRAFARAAERGTLKVLLFP